MKKIYFCIALLFTTLTLFAQNDTLSITLENVRYGYPIKFLPTTIEQQALRMAYMDVPATAKSNGHTIILFHGKNFAGYYWTAVIRFLTEAGYRVIVPDQIGFGKSSKPYIHYSFHQLAMQNKKLLDTLKIEKTIVLGHSMGGMLATRFALLFPEKVEKLILENPIGLEDYRTFVPYVSIEQQYKTEIKATRESVKKYYQSSYFPQWKPEYDWLVTIASGVSNSSDFPRYAKVSAMTYEMIYEEPVVYEFSLLKVPTVLIIGTNDRTIVGKDKLDDEQKRQHGNYAELGKQTASKIPGARLIELNSSHVPHIEIPDEFKKALFQAIR